MCVKPARRCRPSGCTTPGEYWCEESANERPPTSTDASTTSPGPAMCVRRPPRKRMRPATTSKRSVWIGWPCGIGTAPPGRTPSEVEVKCRFLIYRNRVETETDFLVGKREDLLRRISGDWKIARRKIVLDQSVLLAKNLTFFF